MKTRRMAMGMGALRRCSNGAIAVLILAGLTFTAVGCGDGHDHGSHDHGAPATEKAGPEKSVEEPAAKPYPLKTCVVSGEDLGSMGKPQRIVHEGQEIKFCCADCEKEFRKEPEKFMKKIAEAQSPK